jgi:hypothetical protein
MQVIEDEEYEYDFYQRDVAASPHWKPLMYAQYCHRIECAITHPEIWNGVTFAKIKKAVPPHGEYTWVK